MRRSWLPIRRPFNDLLALAVELNKIYTYGRYADGMPYIKKKTEFSRSREAVEREDKPHDKAANFCLLYEEDNKMHADYKANR